MSKRTNLPVTVKEIQIGYLKSPYFKNIYMYSAKNRPPSFKAAVRSEPLAERYLLLDSFLFRLNTMSGKESAVLAIPE